MADSVLSALSTLDLTPTDLQRLGLRSGPLKLRRAWPRTSGHLGLEYTTGCQRIVPGQWFADPVRLGRVARATARVSQKPSVAIVDVAGTQVLLQNDGADRRLRGLAPLLRRPEARLLVHRPERRAVVRFKTAAGLFYGKVVRPERVQKIVAAGDAVQVRTAGALLTPEVCEVDVEAGVVVWKTLPGISLYELGARAGFVQGVEAAGRALCVLHAAEPPSTVAAHDAEAEIGVLRRWLDRLEAFVPDRASSFRVAAIKIFEALATSSSPAVLLHRDFYDKQIFIDDEGRVGLLDFDTLAWGEAALDLANALVHFELRALQGRCSIRQAEAAAAAMLRGYHPGPAVYRRLSTYADATRLRIACVYAFRPYGMPLVPLLLARIGQPVLGANLSQHWIAPQSTPIC
ncbi:MAG: aminoglycoside phosphotransferase family protein [Anaerolineae bacterium]